jgi:hypothetical protein
VCVVRCGVWCMGSCFVASDFPALARTSIFWCSSWPNKTHGTYQTSHTGQAPVCVVWKALTSGNRGQVKRRVRPRTPPPTPPPLPPGLLLSSGRRAGGMVVSKGEEVASSR